VWRVIGLVSLDGIHPTFDGCDRIAKRTLEEMAKAGVRR